MARRFRNTVRVKLLPMLDLYSHTKPRFVNETDLGYPEFKAAENSWYSKSEGGKGKAYRLIGGAVGDEGERVNSKNPEWTAQTYALIKKDIHEIMPYFTGDIDDLIIKFFSLNGGGRSEGHEYYAICKEPYSHYRADKSKRCLRAFMFPLNGENETPNLSPTVPNNTSMDLFPSTQLEAGDVLQVATESRPESIVGDVGTESPMSRRSIEEHICQPKGSRMDN